MSEELIVFRPSVFPKLEECLHFVPKTEENEATRRGARLHQCIQGVLEDWLDLEQPEDVPDASDRADVAWVLGQLRDREIDVYGVEQSVDIRDGEQTLCSGHIDIWGVGGGESWVVDMKTGDMRDYSAQLAGYAKALIDESLLPEERNGFRLIALMLYVDLRLAEEYEVTYDEAADRVASLHKRWTAREAEEPQINDYCGWCAHRGFCKLWQAEAARALTVLPEPDIEPEVIYDIDKIKKDPAQVGRFYLAYKRLCDLVEKDWQIKEAVLDFQLAGVQVPGFKKAEKAGAESVDAEEALHKTAKELGFMRFAKCIKVDAGKLRAEWESFSDKPLPVQITQGAPVVYPQRVTPKGRGRAAALRAERSKEAAALTMER